jgi:hypothetical protein
VIHVNTNAPQWDEQQNQQPYYRLTVMRKAAPLICCSACRTGRLSWEAFGGFTCKLE